MSEWPASNDYTAVIQSPRICFRDADLKNSKPELHSLTRMPKVWTGNFAQVYELRNGNNRWAVKCFTRSSSDVRRRYAVISNAITSSNLPFFVDFHFADNEMLVLGKRYPIVKMEWVEGQSLDKFVEANLYKPQILLDLASRLTEMVKALEAKGLAHGDIQHGNVLIRNNELKLVDYDGMFVPDFKGTLAPEQGLPSYQHPLRNSQYYDQTLDRFPALVISTALCAIAVDPSIWYEFSTGDNLLFTKMDFERPDSSALFSRLRNSFDGQVKRFTELLIIASKSPLNKIPMPNETISIPALTLKPWWVSTSPPLSTSTKANAPISYKSANTNILSGIAKHGSAVTSISFILGFFLLYVAGLLSTPVLSLLAIATLIGYLIERNQSFKKLPVFDRRKLLTKRLIELDKEIKTKLAEQTNIQAEPARLTQLEIQEKSSTLRDFQEKAMIASLARIDISNLGSVEGIGPYILNNLRAAGIYTAADLRGSRLHSVSGVGPKRYKLILTALSKWEKTAKLNIPDKLSNEVEMRITSKYAQQRQGIIHQLNSIGQKISSLRSENSQCQSEFNQLYIPSFGEYLKHNL